MISSEPNGLHVLRLTPHLYWPQLSASRWPVQFDCLGGLHMQVMRQTSAMADLGVTQTVLTLRVPGAPRHWSPDDRTVVKGVRVPLFPLPSRRSGLVDLNASWVAGVVRELRRSGGGGAQQIVHLHSNGSPWALALAGALSSRLDSRLVVTLHCSNLVSYQPLNRSDTLFAPIRRRLEREALRRSDHVIVLNPRVRDYYERTGAVGAESISVVPDSVDVERFRRLAAAPARAAFRRRFGLGDAPFVAFVGRIAREKGWDHLLELAERLTLRDIRFVVCGDGLERDLMEAELRRRGLEQRFTITGFLAAEDVPAAIGAASVLVLPSRSEEFGGVLMEAVALGTPAVGFAVGGIPSTLLNGITGLVVPPGDVGAMARAVERVLDEPQLVERLARAGATDAEARFELRAAATRLLDVYQSVIEDDGRNGSR